MISKNAEVETAISQSFLSEEGKEAYWAKYKERIDFGLMYDL